MRPVPEWATAVILAWGFWVQVATLPELEKTAWYEVGPFDTKEQCQYINDGIRWAGRLFRVVDECTEWK
jgi:hypothetical protein